MGQTNVQPTYSHGGSTVGPFTAVPGTSVSSGRPIFIGDGAVSDPGMVILCAGGNASVLLEGNGGAVNPVTGHPPDDQWFDVSNGGYAMTNGDIEAKFIPRVVPFWRTRIISIDPGAVVQSYCPGLRRDSGDFAPASYPPVLSPAQFTGL